MKKFDQWNKKKKNIDEKELDFDFFYHEREIWWAGIGLNIGIESNGKHRDFERPVLIVRKFNKNQFYGLPLTSVKKTGKFYLKIIFKNKDAWVNFSQLRVFDTKRLLRKIDTLSEKQFLEIKSKLKDFI